MKTPRNFAVTGVSGFVAPRHLNAVRATGSRLVAAEPVHEALRRNRFDRERDGEKGKNQSPEGEKRSKRHDASPCFVRTAWMENPAAFMSER